MAKKKTPNSGWYQEGYVDNNQYTFEGKLCFKNGELYGRIIEENESHIIVELKAKEGEYPQRHEFRKECK